MFEREQRYGDGEPDWTCLLPADHKGPHEWTDPENLNVEFKTPNAKVSAA